MAAGIVQPRLGAFRWSADGAFHLCSYHEKSKWESRVYFLPEQEYSAVHTAVDALNSGQISCPPLRWGNYLSCGVWSDTHKAWYVVCQVGTVLEVMKQLGIRPSAHVMASIGSARGPVVGGYHHHERSRTCVPRNWRWRMCFWKDPGRDLNDPYWFHRP